MEMQRILQSNGLYHNSVRRCLFDNFLLHHPHYLQQFLILPYLAPKWQRVSLKRIIKVFEFTLRGGMTWRRMFVIHPDWYNFFMENAYPTGESRGDARHGVCAERVNCVMRHYKGDLEDAIVVEGTHRTTPATAVQ